MDGKVTYWIEMSDYDLETADAMLLTGRYLYVGFMCHQTIEKIRRHIGCLVWWSTLKDTFAIQISRENRIR